MKTFIFSSIAAILMPLVANAQAPEQVKKILNSLPVTERQQYEAAYEKALVDPTVVSATEDKAAAAQEQKDAVKAALLAIDPSLDSLIGAKVTDPADKKKLADAMAKIRGEAAVRSANIKRMNADKMYRTVLTQALLKADPALTPVLDKLNGKAAATPAAEAPAAE